MHFNNKRVNYIKTKELSRAGRLDLERIQYLLDYNWTGRSLVSHGYADKKVPISLWPKVLERVWKGRTCFWTGREQGTRLECAHSVAYSFLREHLVVVFKSSHENSSNTTASDRGRMIRTRGDVDTTTDPRKRPRVV